MFKPCPTVILSQYRHTHNPNKHMTSPASSHVIIHAFISMLNYGGAKDPQLYYHTRNYSRHSVPIPQIILPMIPCTPNPQCWLCPPIMAFPFSRYYGVECRRSRAVRCVSGSVGLPLFKAAECSRSWHKKATPELKDISVFLIVILCLSVVSQGLSESSETSRRLCHSVYEHDENVLPPAFSWAFKS